MAQAVHVPEVMSMKPTLHVQEVATELGLGELELLGHARQVAAAEAPTVVEYVPAAQSVQTALPVAILYLPATQAVHVPPSGPVYPALHVQAARAVLGLGELELPGHARQADSSVAPVAGEYFPAAQFTHALATLYVPAAHNTWHVGHPVTCTSASPR